MSYHHLTITERCQIYTLKSKNYSIRNIAPFIGRATSTVSRELGRNSGERGYRFKQTHRFAIKRRFEASRRLKRWNVQLEGQIEWMLTSQQWSPEQISGRLMKSKTLISYERIYQHIAKNRLEGGTLFKHLRHKGKRYNYKRGKKARRGLIPDRFEISERPTVVDEKSRIVDWEVDTIIGSQHQGALLTIVDRASKLTLIRNLFDKTASSVVTKVKECFAQLPQNSALTMTFDNGKEFSQHAEISKSLGSKCYFAKPYASWQRGLNEHTNGLCFSQYQ